MNSCRGSCSPAPVLGPLHQHLHQLWHPLGSKISSFNPLMWHKTNVGEEMISVGVWEASKACPAEHSGRSSGCVAGQSCHIQSVTLHSSTLGNARSPQEGPGVVLSHMQGTTASLGCKDTVELNSTLRLREISS